MTAASGLTESAPRRRASVWALPELVGPLTALGAAAMVAPLAAAQGGYFPTAWGWAAVIAVCGFPRYTEQASAPHPEQTSDRGRSCEAGRKTYAAA